MLTYPWEMYSFTYKGDHQKKTTTASSWLVPRLCQATYKHTTQRNTWVFGIYSVRLTAQKSYYLPGNHHASHFKKEFKSYINF